MKIHIDSDERYPHYYFYPDEDGWVPEWYKEKGIEISDELYERIKRIRDEELELQDILENLNNK